MRAAILKEKPGFTLVEVMMAMVILVLLAVGSGSFLLYSRVQVELQKDKRAALEVASGRLEELRAAAYNVTKPATSNYVIRYLKAATNTFTQFAADPGETVNINGGTMPIVTTVQFVDMDGGGSSYDYTLFRVQVGFRVGSTSRVELATFNAP